MRRHAAKVSLACPPSTRLERASRASSALRELHAPAEQHSRDDPVLARDLRDADTKPVAFQRNGVLFRIAEQALGRLQGRAGIVALWDGQARFRRRSVSTSANDRAEG